MKKKKKTLKATSKRAVKRNMCQAVGIWFPCFHGIGNLGTVMNQVLSVNMLCSVCRRGYAGVVVEVNGHCIAENDDSILWQRKFRCSHNGINRVRGIEMAEGKVFSVKIFCPECPPVIAARTTFVE